MSQSLTIQQISNLNIGHSPIRELYIHEINIFDGRVIFSGRSKVQMTPSLATIFASGSQYNYDIDAEEGYNHTSDGGAYLIDVRTGNAAMFWSNEHYYRNEAESFETDALRDAITETADALEERAAAIRAAEEDYDEEEIVDTYVENDFPLVNSQDPRIRQIEEMFLNGETISFSFEGLNANEIEDTLNGISDLMRNPQNQGIGGNADGATPTTAGEGETDWQTISPAEADYLEISGDTSKDYWFVAFDAEKGKNPYFSAGRLNDSFEFRLTEDQTMELVSLLPGDNIVFSLKPFSQGTFTYHYDSTDSVQLFLFKDRQTWNEGVIDLVKTFSTNAPKGLFELAARISKN